MKKNIVIIILSIVILGLGGYLVYDKVIDRDDVELVEEIESKENSNIEVVDFVNVSFDLSNISNSCGVEYYEEPVEIKIPKLDSNKKGTKLINELIQNDLKEWIDSANLEEEAYRQEIPRRMSEYFSFKTDKYISLYIVAESGIECRGGGATAYTYVYDKETDTLVSDNELLYLYGVTSDDIVEAIRQKYESWSSVEDYVVNFNLYGYDGLYINSDDELVVIVNFGAGAGGATELIFSK